MRNNSPRRNMRLVIVESALTSGVIAMPIMTPFYLNIGLDQKHIALSQMICTTVNLLLNLPLGWVADRFSRKWANVIGDVTTASAFLLYSMASNFWSVMLCETLCGVGSALSQGVDSSLLKHFAEKEDPTTKGFRKWYGKLASANHAAVMIMMMLGGPIGAIDFRLAIRVSAVSYLVGGCLGLLICDDSKKLTARHSNPFCDMVELVKRNMHNRQLRLRIASFAVAREITHGIIWVFTPLMMLVGVPISIVSMGWVLNYGASYCGTLIARRYNTKLPAWKLFTIPIVLVGVSCLVMYAHLNIVTVFLYGAFGLANGWTSATMMPLIKEKVEASEQSSIESLARVIAQILYVITIWIINCAADVETHYALLATVSIFIPLAIPIAIKLRKE